MASTFWANSIIQQHSSWSACQRFRGFRRHTRLCDSSEIGYEAWLHLRTANNQGEITETLLCSKSRPHIHHHSHQKGNFVKVRIVWCSLTCTFVCKTLQILNLTVNSFHLCTDSIIVLFWMSPNKWEQFFVKKITQIQHETKGMQWHHIISVDNPADLISRRSHPCWLQCSRLWWHGTHLLSQDQDSWPSTAADMEQENIPEWHTGIKSLVVTNHVSDDFILRYSTLFK
jgi:hypothetical protein